jgi:hypothetical protein
LFSFGSLEGKDDRTSPGGATTARDARARRRVRWPSRAAAPSARRSRARTGTRDPPTPRCATCTYERTQADGRHDAFNDPRASRHRVRPNPR